MMENPTHVFKYLDLLGEICIRILNTKAFVFLVPSPRSKMRHSNTTDVSVVVIHKK